MELIMIAESFIAKAVDHSVLNRGITLPVKTQKV
jgi:hypothetical protein